MTGPRVRLVAWRVQPVVMVDDGDQLVPVDVAPVDVPASEWPAFKSGGDVDALGQLEVQLLPPPVPDRDE